MKSTVSSLWNYTALHAWGTLASSHFIMFRGRTEKQLHLPTVPKCAGLHYGQANIRGSKRRRWFLAFTLLLRSPVRFLRYKSLRIVAEKQMPVEDLQPIWHLTNVKCASRSDSLQ